MLDHEELALLNEYEAGEWTDANVAKAEEEIALDKKAAPSPSASASATWRLCEAGRGKSAFPIKA